MVLLIKYNKDNKENMFKKILTLCFLFLLTNCTTPTSAFLGPIFTGAKTGSIYQASLSYGSNKIIRDLRKLEKKNTAKSAHRPFCAFPL